MNKIGIAIKLTSEGDGSLDVKSGDGDWVKRIRDERNFLDVFKCEGKKYLTFLSFDENGCLITIMISVPLRTNDNVSAYIYVPSVLEVDNKKIKYAWETLKCFLEDQDGAALEKVINETYGNRKYPLCYQPSNVDGGNAYFLLNREVNISDIFRSHLYHQEYTKYKYVFILGYDDSMALKEEEKGKFTLLDPEKLKKSCILLYPKVNTSNVTVYYKKGNDGLKEEFKKGGYLQCLQDDIVTLFYERSGGFNPKTDTVKVTETEQTIEEPNGEWQKYVKKTDFHVFSSKDPKQKIEEFCLFVNGNEVRNSVTIPENKLSTANVKVTAVGYCDLSEENYGLKTPPFNISLKPKYIQKEKNMYLCSPTGEEKIYAKVLYELRDGRTDDFAPKGYECRDCKNYVFKEPAPKPEHPFKLNWLYVLIGAVAILLLIAILFLALNRSGVFYCAFPNEQATEQSKSDNGTQKTAATGESDSGKQKIDYSSAEEAVKYLNGVWTWKKSDMEKYDKLKGLFDGLNFFNLSDLKKKWSTSLKSERLKNLVGLIENLKSEPDSAFTKGDEIRLKDYEDFLKKLNASNTSKNGKDKDKK